MSAETLIQVCKIGFYVCLAIAVLSAVGAVLIFFRGNVRRILSIRSGREAKKSIQEMNEESARTGKLRSQDLDYISGGLTEETAKEPADPLPAGAPHIIHNPMKPQPGSFATPYITPPEAQVSPLKPVQPPAPAAPVAGPSRGGEETAVLAQQTGSGPVQAPAPQAQAAPATGTDMLGNSETSVLGSGTTPLGPGSPGSDETSLLGYGAAAAGLAEAARAIGETVVLSQDEATPPTSQFLFRITQNIIVTHSDELV